MIVNGGAEVAQKENGVNYFRLGPVLWDGNIDGEHTQKIRILVCDNNNNNIGCVFRHI